jgi:putative spermidine/putrescine transport system ATP-binding protein
MLRGDTLEAAATLARNVAAPLRRAGVRRAAHARLVAEALDMVELADAASIRADEASPAQRQRARLARAIVAAPRVLLLDEPFSDHGPRARAALIGALRRIHSLLGATTLLATDEGADALAVADEIAIMQHGVIEQHGPTEEVFDRPHSARTAALFGEVNRLPGIVDALEDDIAMVRLDCGPTVEALAGPGLREHEACVMTLRPDRVAVANVTAAELGGDALDASLIEQRFQGDSYRLRLLIGTGAELVVKRPAASAKLKIGARVALAWQPQHAHAFRAKEEVLF